MRRLTLLLGFLLLAGVAWAQTPPIIDQDFEKIPLGPASADLVADNTWTGNKAEYRVVDTHAVGGRALEVQVNSFAQFILGSGKVEKGKYYRVHATVASLGAKSLQLLLRKGPAPYTAYLSIQDTAGEMWKTLDYTIRCHEDGDALVMMCVYGQGAFWVGDLKIAETDQPPAMQEPPLRGNMVQNSSFELGWDGWVFRDNSQFAPTHTPGVAEIDETLAATGRRSMKMSGDVAVSCPFHPVAYGQSYTLSATIRADYPQAAFGMSVFGSGNGGAASSPPRASGSVSRRKLPFRYPTPSRWRGPMPAYAWAASLRRANMSGWMTSTCGQATPLPMRPVPTAKSASLPTSPATSCPRAGLL